MVAHIQAHRKLNHFQRLRNLVTPLAMMPRRGRPNHMCLHQPSPKLVMLSQCRGQIRIHRLSNTFRSPRSVRMASDAREYGTNRSAHFVRTAITLASTPSPLIGPRLIQTEMCSWVNACSHCRNHQSPALLGQGFHRQNIRSTQTPCGMNSDQ